MALKRHSVIRLETSALLVEVVASVFARSFEVVVPELAATAVEEDGDAGLVADDDGDVLFRLDVLVSSFATELDDAPTVLEGVVAAPLVSLAFELSLELDFDDVSFAATETEVSDFDVSDFDMSDFELLEVVDVVLELGEVVLATEELLLGEVAL